MRIGNTLILLARFAFAKFEGLEKVASSGSHSKYQFCKKIKEVGELLHAYVEWLCKELSDTVEIIEGGKSECEDA